MNNNISKLLGLEDVIVNNVFDEDGVKHIEIELPRRDHKCPCCNQLTKSIHDYRIQKIKDCPAYSAKTVLHLKKRRYVCKNCGKRFYEHNDFLPRYYRMTSRMIADIISKFSETVSATHIAKEAGVSVTTAIRYFDLVEYHCTELPEVLSIDEFKGNADGEKYQSIITDAKNHKIIDVLPNRKEADLIRYFMSFKNRKDVKYVVIDMSDHFRRVAKTCLPNAVIVADRYHVTRQAGWALERVRKNEQKKFSDTWRKYFKRSRSILNKEKTDLTDDELYKLNLMLDISTPLAYAYTLKNEFQDMMHSLNSNLAKPLISKWLLKAENSGLDEFSACTKALHNWSQYILNSFDCPYTNGYTEGCNNKTKVLKRVSYGVRNFNRFRNRILHCAA